MNLFLHRANIFLFLIPTFLVFLSLDVNARIRNRKVKEAPKVCKLMQEDAYLSRDGKKVFGTLRHSLIIEKNEEEPNVSVVKDKGEKICHWTLDEWNSVLKQNGVENLITFKYHIDEYKEVIYPYVQKADSSFFVWSIPLKDCSLTDFKTTEKLDLPKCEVPKRKSKKRKARSSKKKTG